MITNPYWRLMRLHKPLPILLLLWPTAWALWIANQGVPSLKLLVIFILGTIVMRTAGCVINDIADRRLDAHVQRTKDRPLATGELTTKQALVVFVLLAFICLLLLLMLNTATIYLGVIGFSLTLLYPFLKRLTYLPQVLLGALFSWGILMAFSASLGYVPLKGWLLFLIAWVWPIAYDTIYAMIDREDDVKMGMKSTAILFGQQAVPIVMLLQSLVLVALCLYGFWLGFVWTFYVAMGLAALISAYQYRLIQQGDSALYLRAFLNNHWVGLIIFVGIASAVA